MKLLVNIKLIIFLLFFIFYQLFCINLNKRKLRDPSSLIKRKLAVSEMEEINQQKYKWTEEWFENMPIDHFSFVDSRKFKLRYLINTDYFKQNNAPIFFYTGNEGNIEGFAENTGFMWDIAPEFGAAIIFAEHRYYGKTLPFGNESYSNIKNLGYLSSEQALADFAILINYLKEKRLSNANKSPLIAFGGSYGGMLTAWMRIKYPHLIDGAIASSAPIHYFGNSTPPYSYVDITTRTFINNGCSLNLLEKSFNSIRKMANSEIGRKFLNEKYHLSPSSKINNSSDGEQLINYFLGIMDILATVEYPYPTTFLAPLPAWPVKKACKPFSSAKTFEELALALYDGLNMYYNYNNSESLCLWGNDCTYPPNNLGDNGDGWDWQACTEMIIPMCNRGLPFDPFNKSCPYNDQDYIKYCIDDFSKIGYNKDLFRPNWAITNYGLEFPTATNLIFTNGWLDPWSGGGWRQITTNVGSIYSYIIKDGAHHYDLRGANPADTKSVIEVRLKEKKHIADWIDEAKNNN